MTYVDLNQMTATGLVSVITDEVWALGQVVEVHNEEDVYTAVVVGLQHPGEALVRSQLDT